MVCITIDQAGDYLGQEVTLQGWLYNKRSSGRIQFLEVRDGTGWIQAVVVRKEVDEAVWGEASRLTQESSLTIRGTLKEEPRSKWGYEIWVSDITIVQLAEEYPITLKEHGTDFLMDHRHLWIRVPRQQAILRIRHEIIWAMQEWLNDQGFIRVDTPILTPNACEGTTTLFDIEYFGDKAYLAQTGQLYSEATIGSLRRVYCFGPAFRAEKSKTRRHAIEFWMLEPEMAFCDQEENMRIQEELVAYVVHRVLERRGEELVVLGRDTAALRRVVPPFPRITYDEAIDFLKAHGEELPWGEDFGAPHETIIASQFDRPVFVTNYPSQVKAFYMKPHPERPEVAICADLLAPEGYGEIIGGSQRIDDLDLLKQRIREHNLPEDAFKWYLDLRRYGSVPHSGFGIGLERTVTWICGLDHIREASAFPRLLNRIYP